jgi:imidazolonepropionase-like amidohydrolase
MECISKAGRYLTGQGILIRDGIIRQVGRYDALRSAAPRDAAELDLSGLTILPGLIDCHTHLLIAAPEKMNGADALILTITKLSPMKRALLGAQLAKEDLESGFTIVRNVGHSGIDGDVALREAIDNRWVPGPRILASARKIAPEGGQEIPVQGAVLELILKEEFLTASNPDEGRRAVLDDLRVGANWIKAVADEGPRTINLETMKAIVEEAHRSGVRVAVHASSQRGLEALFRRGARKDGTGAKGRREDRVRVR